MKQLYVILIVLALAVGVFIYATYPESEEPMNAKKITGCINSGGIIKSSLCCESANPFPSTCMLGACSCSPESSKNLSICDCGEGKCFNGERCITWEGSDE